MAGKLSRGRCVWEGRIEAEGVSRCFERLTCLHASRVPYETADFRGLRCYGKVCRASNVDQYILIGRIWRCLKVGDEPSRNQAT